MQVWLLLGLSDGVGTTRLLVVSHLAVAWFICLCMYVMYLSCTAEDGGKQKCRLSQMDHTSSTVAVSFVGKFMSADYGNMKSVSYLIAKLYWPLFEITEVICIFTCLLTLVCTGQHRKAMSLCWECCRLRARFTNVDQISVQLNQVQRWS